MRNSLALRLVLGVVAVVATIGILSVIFGAGDGADDGGSDTESAGDAAGDSGAASDATGDAAGDTDDSGWHGGLLTESEPRPDFTLTDTSGQPYSFRERTAGQLTLLFFGYTSCPDICPIHLATLSQALEADGMPDPIVVFVTTDPQRDTPEQLRTWLDTFDPGYVGLTGTLEQISEAERIVGVAHSFPTDSDGRPIEQTPADGSYEVGHASQIVAYTPDDLAHIVYPFGVQRDDWEADLPRLAEGWPGDQS